VPELEAVPAPYAPRRFTPVDANLLDPATVTELYTRLLDRAIASEPDLEAWAEDESELASAIDQVCSRLFANMTCNTDNPAHAAAYRKYIDTIPPVLKPLTDAFHKKYLAQRKRFPRTSALFAMYDRKLETETALFRDTNVPLQTQEDLLSQDYQTLMGAQLTTFEGKEYTPQQMAKFLQEPDRDLREAAWRALSRRRLADKDAIHKIFAEQVRIRHQQAVNAGLHDYVDYAFAQKHRYDYTREDCRGFHAAVEKYFTPLRREALERRRNILGVDRLRPWDLSVDPEGKPPLKPFAEATELIVRTHQIFEDIDPELAAQFDSLRTANLLDLDNRKGKAPGGYQLTLEEARRPFIFMNAVGVDNDVRILLHEGGHAFHALLSADHSLLSYRNPPIEFAEVASFGMELLGGEFMQRFYGDRAEQTRSRRDFLESKISLLPWVATVDAFQHWLYEQHAFDPERAVAQWVTTMNRFSSGVVDWSGFEEEQAHMWHAQVHFFTSPMYYIEYGIAQLGALQLWVHSQQDRAKALQQYKEALALGGSKPLPELFATAGLNFDLGERVMAPVAKTLCKELAY
jgi:oligoendopeptidase F